MCRLYGLFAIIVGLFAVVTAPIADVARGADEKSAVRRDVVCLTCREVDHIDTDECPLPLLGRELVRQAFLIAARDESGLFTRDATLREEFPASAIPRSVLFDMYSFIESAKQGADYCYFLGRVGGKTPEKLWEWQYHVDVGSNKSPQAIATLAEQAEALSRGPFKELLKHQGLGRAVPAARTAAAVPAHAEDELWAWNEIAVLGGLRRIHSEIHEKGESPELLAALAVGYANLGMLTEYYFSAAPKAFSARALLYAERLLRITDRSAWALWHRAYVRAIVGLHHLADADIVAAKEKRAKSPAAQPSPFWTSVVETFLQAKLSRMLLEAKSPPQQRLARYLNFEAAMWAMNNELRVKAGEAVVAECPDCFRALDGMCSMHYLGVMRMVADRSFELMGDNLRRRLPETPGLPEQLAIRIKEHTPLAEKSDEVEFRVQFVGDVRAAARSGEDNMEPSLAALAQTIEEIEFKQLMRKLELERYVLGIPTDETIAVDRPLCERHPYGAFVDLFSNANPDVLKGALTLIQKIDSAELTNMMSGPFIMGQSFNPKKIRYWITVIYCHSDPVIRDEIIGIDEGAAGKPEESQYNDPYMKMLADTSSKFPVAIAAQITRNWKETKSRAAELETEYLDDPLVLTALANKYIELKQYDNAERCAKQTVRVAPDYSSYRRLAAIYKSKQDMVRWKETLEESLSLPSRGLEQFSVRDMLARYHMRRKEWKQALPYAEGAAASYSAWGLESAAQCREMLGDWKKSESLMRAISERYDDSAFDWMVWCHRTGHGDEREAADLARRHFESLGTAATPVQLESIGVYYLFQREPEKALAVFEKGWQHSKNVYHAMHAAIIADTLGDAAKRDMNLEKILVAGLHVEPKGVVGVYSRIARLMKSALPPHSMKDFDFKDLDAVLDDARKGAKRTDTNLKYFIGVFLKNRGDVEKSRYYLTRSAQTAQYSWQNLALACELLREMKVPFEPLGDEKPGTDDAADP